MKRYTVKPWSFLVLAGGTVALSLGLTGTQISGVNGRAANSEANSRVQTQDDRKEVDEYLRLLAELRVKRDAEALMEFRRQVATKWRDKPEARVLLESEICKSLNSGPFNLPKHTLYARECAKDLLKNVSDLSPETELDMVKILQEVEEYRLGVVDRELWSKDRKERIGFLRHAYNRIRGNYDPSFDFSDPTNIPPAVVCVPSSNYQCGIRPELVLEPEIRARYIAAINENKRRVRKFNAQRQIHQLIGRLSSFVDRFIIGMYSQQPADFVELESVMHSFAIDRHRKENIRREIRERLERR